MHEGLPQAAKENGLRSRQDADDIVYATTANAFHSLMVLCDSALPLGSFAFSSGLESCLAHSSKNARSTDTAVFKTFLRLSIQSVASAALPFVGAGHEHPQTLAQLDNDLDASMPCIVARRASIAQGRALLTMWDRSLKGNVVPHDSDTRAACEALSQFSLAIKRRGVRSSLTPDVDDLDHDVCGHLAPLFGTLAAAMSLNLGETIYLFLLNHAKALLSAGIRASVIGPYQSQGLLASSWLRDIVLSLAKTELAKPTAVEEAGQSVPIIDVWTGRHEIIYSRIFNS